MPLYTCELCKFSSKLKSNHKRHLNTAKHKRNLEQSLPIEKKRAKKSQKEPEKSQKEPEKSQQILEYHCKFCNEQFKTFANKRRHELHRCDHNALNYKKLYNKSEKEKTELYKKIEKLLDKVGNTTHIQNNTATQNIQLNNYGREDMSHITDNIKNSLLKMPYGMIPKMIEAVHFNDCKPENKNIVLPNKNEKRIKIFSGNKWVYKGKEEIISDLVDGKYFIMDAHYDNVSEQLNTSTSSNYLKFKEYFNEGDKELIESLRKECELVLLNNR
jgi:hypothetical protein